MYIWEVILEFEFVLQDINVSAIASYGEDTVGMP